MNDTITIDENYNRDMGSKALIASQEKYAQYKQKRASWKRQQAQSREIETLQSHVEELQRQVALLIKGQK